MSQNIDDPTTWDVRNYDGCDPRRFEPSAEEAESYMNYLVARNAEFARELAKHILTTFDANGRNVEHIGGDILDSKVLNI